MVVRTSKAQKKELTRSPRKPRFNKRLLEKFGAHAKAKMTALKATAVALGIGMMVSCTPAAVIPQDTVKRNPAVAGVSATEIEYEPFSDPKALEPYFENAKGKLVKLKFGEEKKVGDYLVSAKARTRSVDFRIKSKDGSYEEWGITLNSKLENINLLVIDMGDSNPYIKGEMLVLADYDTVYFQYYRKVGYTDESGQYMPPGHSLKGVALEEGKMRSGPIRTGFGIDDGGVFVINAPETLENKDVVCQAIFRNNGDSGPYWYRYYGPDTMGVKRVARLDK